MQNFDPKQPNNPNPAKSPIMISSYSHKGGVGKTTSVFNLAHLLAYDLKYNVLMVDADPQCSLTSMAVRKRYTSSMKSVYSDSNIQRYITENYHDKNIFALIQPTCEKNQTNIADTVQKEIEDNLENRTFVVKNPYLDRNEDSDVEQQGNLFLLPGNNRLFEFERIVSRSLDDDRYYNGAAALLPYSIRKVAMKHNIDIILIDCNPGSTLVIASLLNGSDYFMVPVMPDHYSHHAIWSLSHIIPEWTKTLNQDVVERNEQLPDGNLRFFPAKMPKFLGLIQQRVKTRYLKKEQKEEIFGAYDAWLKRIYRELNSSFKPSLKDENLLQPLIEPNCLDYPEYIIPIITGVPLDEEGKNLPIVAITIQENNHSQSLLAKLRAYRSCYINVLFSLFENMSENHKQTLNLVEHVAKSKDVQLQECYQAHQTLTQQKRARIASATKYYNHPLAVVTDSLKKYLDTLTKDTDMRKAVIKDLLATPLSILKQSSLMQNDTFRSFTEELEADEKYQASIREDLSQLSQVEEDDDDIFDLNRSEVSPYDLLKDNPELPKKIQFLAQKNHRLIEAAIQYFLSDAVHFSIEVLNCKGGLLDYLEEKLNVKIEIFGEESGPSTEKAAQIRPYTKQDAGDMNVSPDQNSSRRFVVSMNAEGKFCIRQDPMNIAHRIELPDTVGSRTSIDPTNLAPQESPGWYTRDQIPPKLSKPGEGKVIAMFNYKGGVGKTTTTQNLSVMLARQGYRVLVIDADTQCSLSSMMMGDDYYLYNLWSKLNAHSPQTVTVPSGGEKTKNLTIRRDIISCFYDILQGNVIGQLREDLEITNPMAERLYLDTLRFFKTSQAGVYILPSDSTHHVQVECQLINLLRNKHHTDQSNLKFSLSLIKQISRQFDFVFVDMSPSPSATNSLFFLGCPFLMTPTNADYLACQSARSLPVIFQDWLLKYTEFFIENLIKQNKSHIKTPKIYELIQNLDSYLGFPQLIQMVPNRFALKADHQKESKWDTPALREKKEEFNASNFLMKPQDENFNFIAEITQFMSQSYKKILLACIEQITGFKELLELKKALSEPEFIELSSSIKNVLLRLLDRATEHCTIPRLTCIQGIPDHNSLGLQLQADYIPIAMAAVSRTPSKKSAEFIKATKKYNFAYTELACDLILKVKIDFVPLHFYFHLIHRWCIRFFNIDFETCFDKRDNTILHDKIKELSNRLYTLHQLILKPEYQILTGRNYTSGHDLRPNRAIVVDDVRSGDLSTIENALDLLQTEISGMQITQPQDVVRFISTSKQLVEYMQKQLQPIFELMEEIITQKVKDEAFPDVFGTLKDPSAPQYLLPVYQSEIHNVPDIYFRYSTDVSKWLNDQANNNKPTEKKKRKAISTLSDNNDNDDESTSDDHEQQTSAKGKRQNKSQYPKLLFPEATTTAIKQEPVPEVDHRADLMAEDDDSEDNPLNRRVNTSSQQ